jgi:ATP phosphoribosyltransferase regulatory subunit
MPKRRPSPATEADVLGAILSLKADLPDACERLRDMTVDMPGLTKAVDRLRRPHGRPARRGPRPRGLPFEASFGRTTMEYYDGFVFGFLAPARPTCRPLPPVGATTP